MCQQRYTGATELGLAVERVRQANSQPNYTQKFFACNTLADTLRGQKQCVL
jgi:hypothetical protein